MVDSISMYKILSDDELKVIGVLNSGGEEFVNVNTGEYRFKRFLGDKRMSMMITGDRIWIKGSLSQYYHESYDSLSWSEVEFAIKRIEDEIGVDLSSATITQIDLECTFSLSRKPSFYMNFLGDSPYFNHFKEKNTVYYNSGTRKIKIYDKGKKNRGDKLHNLLRYELSLKSKYLTQNYGRKLTVIDLYSADIQTSLIDLWYASYLKINKYKAYVFDMSEIESIRDLKNGLLGLAIKHLGGHKEFIEVLSSSLQNNLNLDSKTKYRIVNGIKQLDLKTNLKSIENMLIDELNKAMENSFLQQIDDVKKKNSVV